MIQNISTAVMQRHMFQGGVPPNIWFGIAAACDALWEGLERQCIIMNGQVPTLEHPSVKQKRMVRHSDQPRRLHNPN